MAVVECHDEIIDGKRYEVTMAHPQGDNPVVLDRRIVINAKNGDVGKGKIRRLEIDGTNLIIEYIEPDNNS